MEQPCGRCDHAQDRLPVDGPRQRHQEEADPQVEHRTQHGGGGRNGSPHRVSAGEYHGVHQRGGREQRLLHVEHGRAMLHQVAGTPERDKGVVARPIAQPDPLQNHQNDRNPDAHDEPVRLGPSGQRSVPVRFPGVSRRFGPLEFPRRFHYG